jgi:hypothetical protein
MMKQKLKQLVEKHIEKIDNEDFSEIFENVSILWMKLQ